MKLYELIEQISHILTPKTNSLFDYIISTSDNNGGFLRTCYTRKNDKLEDFDIKEMDKVLVCFAKKFIEGNYYYDNNFTKIKMQIFYFTGDIEKYILWSFTVGFKYAYVFDLKKKTYTYKEVKIEDMHMKRSKPIRERKLRKFLE